MKPGFYLSPDGMRIVKVYFTPMGSYCIENEFNQFLYFDEEGIISSLISWSCLE